MKISSQSLFEDFGGLSSDKLTCKFHETRNARPDENARRLAALGGYYHNAHRINCHDDRDDAVYIVAQASMKNARPPLAWQKMAENGRVLKVHQIDLLLVTN